MDKSEYMYIVIQESSYTHTDVHMCMIQLVYMLVMVNY